MKKITFVYVFYPLKIKDFILFVTSNDLPPYCPVKQEI